MDEVQGIITAALDMGFHDGMTLWIDASPGGIGSTSCSIILTISNADSWEKEYIVEVHDVSEPED